MNDDDNEFIELGVPGRASRVDKWKYNDILNDLARRALYTMGTPVFSYWSYRFVKALQVVNIKNLPLKRIIYEKNEYLLDVFHDKKDDLKKKRWIWHDEYKRDCYLDLWGEQYWCDLFEFCLELATKAGFTLQLDSIDESVALRA